MRDFPDVKVVRPIVKPRPVMAKPGPSRRNRWQCTAPLAFDGHPRTTSSFEHYTESSVVNWSCYAAFCTQLRIMSDSG